jgi:hypothetical protein
MLGTCHSHARWPRIFKALGKNRCMAESRDSHAVCQNGLTDFVSKGHLCGNCWGSSDWGDKVRCCGCDRQFGNVQRGCTFGCRHGKRASASLRIASGRSTSRSRAPPRIWPRDLFLEFCRRGVAIRAGSGRLPLGVSALFDGTTWLLALRNFKGHKHYADLFKAIRKSKDPPSFMVLFEDVNCS